MTIQNAVTAVAATMTGSDIEDRALVMVVSMLDATKSCRGWHVAADGSADTNWVKRVEEILEANGLVQIGPRSYRGGKPMARRWLTDAGKRAYPAALEKRMAIWEAKRF